MSSVNDKEELLEKKVKSTERENQHATKQATITQQFKELINLLKED